MGTKASILIVDDNISMCKTTSFVLKRKGYGVEIAEDGLEAIEEVKRRPFEVIFIDIKMPLMNGVETYKKIKAIRPEAVVIMMTAYAVEDLVQESIQEGAYGVVYKPLDMEKVIALIERARKSKERALKRKPLSNPDDEVQSRSFFKVSSLNDEEKTKEQPIEELTKLHQRIAKLEEAEAVHKRTEEELQKSEEKLRNLFEYAIDAIFAMDLNGTYTQVNKRVLEIHGLSSKEEILGKSGFDFVARNDVKRAKAGMKEVLEQGAVVRQEYNALKSDGSEFPVEVSGTLLKDASGNPVGIIGITRDITERKRAEEELKKHRDHLEELVDERTAELKRINEILRKEIDERKRAEEKLKKAHEELLRREKLALLGQLAGGVGHELRNPLGAIKNSLYFLKMALKKPNSEVKETLELLGKEVTTSERIISSLLDFARPRSPLRKDVNVNKVIQDTLSRMPVPANIKVVSKLDKSLPCVFANPIQLSQAFGNVVLNAIQAMPDGGQLILTSELEGPEQIVISFIDTGNGISKKNLRRLFKPLFTTKAKGIGLGLAITKVLVEGHGGTIEVESKVREGSTFTLKLPILKKEKKSDGKKFKHTCR